MAQLISNLPIDAKIKYGKHFGAVDQWIIKARNHTGYPQNSTTIVTYRLPKIMAADAREPQNSSYNRQTYSNNRQIYTNMRQWLNKSGPNWYVAQHTADAPPSATLLSQNPYQDIDGWLSGFTQQELDAVLTTTLTVNKAGVDGGGQEKYSDRFFILSAAEVGLSTDTPAEGNKLAGFSDDASRLANPTAEAVKNSNYTDNGLKENAAWMWWLRTPYVNCDHDTYLVHLTGGRTNTNGALGYGRNGLRVACNLPNSQLVSDTPDADGCYTLVFNRPPEISGGDN